MLQAIQIMLAAVAIAVATGFLISLLIQFLCWVVGLRRTGEADDAAAVALAVAVALRRKRQ